MEINEAFSIMMLSTPIEIKRSLRKEWIKINPFLQDNVFYITSINYRGSLTICGDKHSIFEGVSLKDIVKL